MLTHYVGDIHQPLHVGAEYFNEAGHPVDPDRNQSGIEDEGGNLINLRLAHRSRAEMARKGPTLHGFWDNEAVLANLPPLSPAVSNEERYQRLQYFQSRLIGQLINQPPTNWRTPAGIELKNYGEQWADDILPVAREAHRRLRFVYMRATADQGRIIMAGDARENPTPDGAEYADWAARIVRDELHKAGWRLADLLTQAVESPSDSALAAPPK